MNWNHWTHNNAGHCGGGGGKCSSVHFNDGMYGRGSVSPQMCGVYGPSATSHAATSAGDAAELAAFRNNFIHFQPQPQPQPMVGAGCWYSSGLNNLLMDDKMYFGSSDRRRCGGAGGGGIGNEDSGRGECQGRRRGGGGGNGCKAEWLPPTDSGAGRVDQWPSGWTRDLGFGLGFGNGGGAAGLNAGGQLGGNFPMVQQQQQLLPDI